MGSRVGHAAAGVGLIAAGVLLACGGCASSSSPSCQHPDPDAYAGGNCVSLQTALAKHHLVLPADATQVHFKSSSDDQLWLTFTAPPDAVGRFASASHQCTPSLGNDDPPIDSYTANQVGWPYAQYIAKVHDLLTCIDGTTEQDEITVYQSSPTEVVLYFYSESMQAFN